MKVISFLTLLILFSCAHKEAVHPIEGPLNAKQFNYRQCYLESNSFKGRASPPPGQMIVSFKITKEGKVEDEKILESTFAKDPNFEACVLDQIRQVKFGKFDTTTEVTQPINFIPVY
ncbi:MAG: TonB family protein [Bacteriovoracia bacterium]